MCVIGEQLDPTGSDVCGISVIKKHCGARIEVWVRDAENLRSMAIVGRRIRRLNLIRENDEIEFRKHGGDVIYTL